MGRATSKMSRGICGWRRPRSDCASAQSDQDFHCLLTESLDTTECMNEEQSPGCTGLSESAHVQRHFFSWCSRNVGCEWLYMYRYLKIWYYSIILVRCIFSKPPDCSLTFLSSWSAEFHEILSRDTFYAARIFLLEIVWAALYIVFSSFWNDIFANNGLILGENCFPLEERQNSFHSEVRGKKLIPRGSFYQFFVAEIWDKFFEKM